MADVLAVSNGEQTRWDLMSESDRAPAEAVRFGGHCSGCAEFLPTEADFAKHFIIYRGYRNLGYCPDRGPKRGW